MITKEKLLAEFKRIEIMEFGNWLPGQYEALAEEWKKIERYEPFPLPDPKNFWSPSGRPGGYWYWKKQEEKRKAEEQARKEEEARRPKPEPARQDPPRYHEQVKQMTPMTPVEDYVNQGGRPSVLPEYNTDDPTKRRKMQIDFYVEEGRKALLNLPEEIRNHFLNANGQPRSRALVEQIGRAYKHDTQKHFRYLVDNAARMLKEGKPAGYAAKYIQRQKDNRRG